MADTPRYRFGPLERRGMLLGLRGTQLLVLGCALCFAVLALSAAPNGQGVVAAAVVAGVAGFICFVPLSGRTVEEWTPVVLRWIGKGLRGELRFVSHQPTLGQTASVEPQPVWPPQLKGVELLATPAPGAKASVGVLKEKRAGTYTGVLSVRGKSFSLLDDSEKTRRLATWAGILAGLAREGAFVHRVQWLERTIPDPGNELADYLKESIAVPYASSSVRSYLEVLDEAGPVTQQHETLVALQISAARSSRAIKAAGGGDTGACEVLRRELSSLSMRLMGADLSVAGALTPRLLARAVRTGFDPLDRMSLARIESRAPEREGTLPTNAAPMATDERWGSFRADATYHSTYWIAEWPRVDVDPDFLAPLLLRTSQTRTVSLVMEPVSPMKAMRSVESARTQAMVDEQMRSKAGYTSTARRQREQESLESHEHDLSHGHAFFRFSGLVTVHAATPEELENACGEIEQAAGQSFLDLRMLHGQQAEAFTWSSLPLCRGLR